MTEGHERRGWAARAAISGALIIAGVGAGLAGAFETSGSWLVRGVVAAVGAVAGLAAAIGVDRFYQRREARAAALRARDDVLEELVAEPASGGSVFDVLLATSTEAAPFRGRRDDLAWLERWWDDPGQLIVMVTGPAGVGKTRLVTEFALGRPAPWISRWLREGRGADVVAAIRGCGDPALVLVDDADQRSDLATLLESLKEDRGAGPAVRILLISRAAGLAGRLAAALGDRSRGLLEGVGERPLGTFGSADDRARWFGEAVRAYARARQVPPPDLPAHLSGPVTDPAEPILTLHAQALLAVLDSEGSRPMRPRAEVMPFDRVAAALFAHEHHRWQVSARRPEFGLTDLTSPVQTHAIAALLLASPADLEQAVAALRCLPELVSEASEERRANIARWAVHLYPGDPPWPIQIKPSVLAGWFTVTQLTQSPELAAVLRAMTPTQEAALLVLLARASDYIPQAAQLFADVIGGDTVRLAGAGVTAALVASAGQPRLDGELASLVLRASWPTDALRRAEERLTESLPRTRAAAAQVQVKIARADGNAAGLANALNYLWTCLEALGRYEEALAPAEEAVGLWRPLASGNPAHQPGLATALRNLARCLDTTGRYEEGVAAAEESVGLWRPLASGNPAYQPGLAVALNNLGACLWYLGRYEEALAAMEESVGLWRPLTVGSADVRARAAWALNNLGICLQSLGRDEEGLAYAEESVGLWRLLASGNPAHQPGLAAALESLGTRLWRLGRYQEAVAAAEEAVGLWRPLASGNPARQPGLVMALNDLGICLDALGRYREAVAAAEEAVGLWRPLASGNPAHQPNFAMTLNNLGTYRNHLDRHEEALAAAEESVGLWRPLASGNPAHQRGLAMAVENLGICLGYVGRYEEALAAAEESVGLWRPLASGNPAHQPSLAKALGNLGVPLNALGRYEDALAAAEESVGLWRLLASGNPVQYEEKYKRALAELRRDLQLHGKESASIQLYLDPSRDRDQPHHSPSIIDSPER